MDRESFLDAQVRNRRASRSFTALSALAIALMGIPLSAVISPLLYAAAIVALDVLNLIVPMPDPIAWLGGQHEPVTVWQWVVVGLAVVLPGSVALLAAWLGVRRAFRRAGAGATVLALGARPPGKSSEEQQVVNVVGELAVAAGVPAPAVAVIDSAVPNAAAVGTSFDDCTVVVTRGLLEGLDREETQGVLAHVVGSVGNGDLRIGTTIASVFQTMGLVSTVLGAPGDRGARRLLWRLVRGKEDPAVLAEALLAAAVDQPATSTEVKGPLGFVKLPCLMTAAAFDATASLWGMVLLTPMLRRAWVARRHLADASAVALTRNADGVARGVALLRPPPEGTDWTAHLFAAGEPEPKETGRSMRAYQPRLADRMDRLRAMGATDAPVLARPRASKAVVAVVVLLTSPCWVPLFGLMLVAPLLIGYAAVLVDALFLAPVVALLHALLR